MFYINTDSSLSAMYLRVTEQCQWPPGTCRVNVEGTRKAVEQYLAELRTKRQLHQPALVDASKERAARYAEEDAERTQERIATERYEKAQRRKIAALGWVDPNPETWEAERQERAARYAKEDAEIAAARKDEETTRSIVGSEAVAFVERWLREWKDFYANATKDLTKVATKAKVDGPVPTPVFPMVPRIVARGEGKCTRNGMMGHARRFWQEMDADARRELLKKLNMATHRDKWNSVEFVDQRIPAILDCSHQFFQSLRIWDGTSSGLQTQTRVGSQ